VPSKYLKSLLAEGEGILLITRQHWFLLVSAILLEVVLTIVVLVGVTLLPVAAGMSGGLYFASALVLGGLFLASAWQLARRPDERRARSTFSYSMLYLALLFAALAIDAVI
jgi:heme O synthase-like polyprenyltransferase